MTTIRPSTDGSSVAVRDTLPPGASLNPSAVAEAFVRVFRDELHRQCVVHPTARAEPPAFP